MLNNCIVFMILHNALLLIQVTLLRWVFYLIQVIVYTSNKNTHTDRQISSTISITSLGMRLRTVVCRIGDVQFKAAKHKNETPQTPSIHYSPIL